MPNLYLVGGAVAGAIMLLLATFFYGEHVSTLAYEAKIAEMNLAMQKAKSDHDLFVAQTNAEVEKANADHQHALDDAGGRIAGLAADLDRLRAASGPNCRNQVRVPAVIAGKPAINVGPDPGSFSDLADIAAACVRTAAYADTFVIWRDKVTAAP